MGLPRNPQSVTDRLVEERRLLERPPEGEGEWEWRKFAVTANGLSLSQMAAIRGLHSAGWAVVDLSRLYGVPPDIISQVLSSGHKPRKAGANGRQCNVPPLSLVASLRAEGLSFTKMADHLNKLSFTSSTGLPLTAGILYSIYRK
jgi:hypothetical protein